MHRDLLLKISLVMCAISLLLVPLIAQSSRPKRSENDTIRNVVTAQPQPLLEIPTIPSGRDPFSAPVAAQARDVAADAFVVHAIALGNSPAALVNENGNSRILQIGDSAAGSRVMLIDVNAVTLADGRRIKVSNGRNGVGH